MSPYMAAVFCVFGLAAGQILFKMSAVAARDGGTFLSLQPLTALLAAMILYAVTSLGWVWILQKAELGRIYPFMALAFVLVPAGSYAIFGERFQAQYFVGVAFIVVGIVVIAKS